MADVPYDSCNYSDFWIGREYENQSEKIAISQFLNKITYRDSIIDIGGGFGRLSSLYAPIFQKCLVVDPSESLLAEAQKSLKSLKNLKFLKSNSEKLPNDQFEVALLVRVVHHLPDPLPTFKEVYRVLHPEGCFILEFANKNHFLSVLRSLSLGNLSYLNDLNPVDIRSEQAKKEGKIIFLNHHPKKIQQQLRESGFKIIDRLSVSNFRHPLIKWLIPEKILLFFENLLQKPLSYLNFGPSIFLLCQKQRSNLTI